MAFGISAEGDAFLIGATFGAAITLIAILRGDWTATETKASETNLEVIQELLQDDIPACYPRAPERKLTGEVEYQDYSVEGTHPESGGTSPGKERANPDYQMPSEATSDSNVELIELEDLSNLAEFLYPNAPKRKEHEANSENNVARSRNGATQQYYSANSFRRLTAFRAAVPEDYHDLVNLYFGMQAELDRKVIPRAIAKNDVEVIRLLFSTQDLDSRSKEIALEEAAYRGRLEILQFIIDTQVDVNGSETTHPLTAAAAGGNVDVVKRLVLSGADLEDLGRGSMVEHPSETPLIAAVARNCLSTAKTLLESGANVYKCSKPENAPMAVAIRARLPEMILLLLRYNVILDVSAGELEEVLRVAIETGHFQLARMMIQAGANIKARIPFYGSFIQYAAALGHRQLVILLISAGSSVGHFQSRHHLGGNCPLMAAVTGGNANVVQLLLDQGAVVKGAESCFGNILQTASSLGYYDIIDILLAQSPDIEINGTSGVQLSPLFLAIYNYWLIFTGKADGMTESHYLAVIRTLLKHGAVLRRFDLWWFKRETGFQLHHMELNALPEGFTKQLDVI